MTSASPPSDPLDVAAAAFSSRLRLDILAALTRSPGSTAHQVAADLGVIRSTLGVNLRALESAGLVLADDPSAERSGRRLRYRINMGAYDAMMAAVHRHIA
ncbi:ArsR/SmtB family transcription factor [Micrococcus endophyticus]